MNDETPPIFEHLPGLFAEGPPEQIAADARVRAVYLGDTDG